jgi:hypothetical protein
VGAPLIAWGFGCWLRRHPAAIGSLAAGSALLVIWVLGYGDVSDSKVWLIPVGAVLALLGGLGLARLAARLPGRFVGPSAMAGTGAAICLLLLFTNWSRADRSDMWGHRDIWAAMVPQLEKNAILVGETDTTMFVFRYLQVVEEKAKDLTVLSTPSLWEEWYLGLIEDGELRRAVEQEWEATSREHDLRKPGTHERWNGVAKFSYRLAQHYRGRRAIYAQHGPILPFPGPPYFVGLTDGFYRLDFTLPDMIRPADKGDPTVGLPGGIGLTSLTVTPTEAKTGQLVEFRARWKLEKPLPGMLFALRLVPALGAPESAWRRLLGKSCFQQGYPVLYGLWNLSPSPAGTVYEQVGKYIIPSNAPAGEYRLELGYAQSLPPRYAHWVSLGDRVLIQVSAGPLPANPP